MPQSKRPPSRSYRLARRRVGCAQRLAGPRSSCKRQILHDADQSGIARHIGHEESVLARQRFHGSLERNTSPPRCRAPRLNARHSISAMSMVPSPLLRQSSATESANSLSLPEIKSGRIDGAILPGAAWRRCCQLPEPPAKPVHPCPALDGCEPRCNIADTIRAGDEDAARQIQQHDPSNPA